MLFWIICFVLTCVVAVVVITPLVRPPQDAGEDPQIALYKAQLDEVDRDVARDVLDASEAAQAKTEIARRLLAASKGPALQGESPFNKSTAIITALVLLILAGVTYARIGAPGYPDFPLQARIEAGDAFRANRPSQETAQAAAPVLEIPDYDADYIASIVRLRTIVPQNPDELQGWELLAFHESQMRDYAAAAVAQGNVIRLKGDDVVIDDLITHADFLAAAADGYISPQTEQIALRILQIAPENIAGRYYLGAMYDQTDRPDRAFQLWRSILDAGHAETFHLALARRFVEDAAIRAGTSYTPPPATDRALSDLLGDENMDADAQADMIGGMVARLADRLGTQGGPATEWARLIVAYGVLDQLDDARAIMAEASDVFGASESAMEILNEAAMRAGIAE